MTADGTVTTYPIPTSPAGPASIAVGSDGALWFVELDGNRVGRVTTSGAVTEYILPTAGVISEHQLPRGDNPVSIALGADGALWYVSEGNGKVGRMTTAGAVVEYSTHGTQSAPFSITPGPDGALWFTELFGNRIGRITTTGTLTEYPLPAARRYPSTVGAGPDGAVWFVEEQHIGRVTSRGSITEYAAPNLRATSINGLITGPDAAVWFTERDNNALARFLP
jgi:virginiamycin B lyase